MRAIKSLLAFSYFRVLVATSMDDSEEKRRSRCNPDVPTGDTIRILPNNIVPIHF